eukprot:1155809-Pelagomonas_calceolata.AAC.3
MPPTGSSGCSCCWCCCLCVAALQHTRGCCCCLLPLRCLPPQCTCSLVPCAYAQQEEAAQARQCTCQRELLGSGDVVQLLVHKEKSLSYETLAAKQELTTQYHCNIWMLTSGQEPLLVDALAWACCLLKLHSSRAVFIATDGRRRDRIQE